MESSSVIKKAGKITSLIVERATIMSKPWDEFIADKLVRVPEINRELRELIGEDV